MTEKQPKGQVLIQTLAMPADTNANGDIFGGWLVSQMDLAGGILAKTVSTGRAATVAIQSLTFKLPVHVGDLLSCYVELIKQGNTSMTINVEAWQQMISTGERHCAAEGVFVFVAIDEHGRPRKVISSRS